MPANDEECTIAIKVTKEVRALFNAGAESGFSSRGEYLEKLVMDDLIERYGIPHMNLILKYAKLDGIKEPN
jgi:hypothetical protein